jgi:hypothetical protein
MQKHGEALSAASVRPERANGQPLLDDSSIKVASFSH